MSRPVTASALERTFACPASAALPRAISTSDYAESGTTKHGFVSAVLRGRPVSEALANIDDDLDREACRALDWARLIGDLADLESEAAFAIDVKRRTARRLGHDIGRDYEGAALRAGGKLSRHEVVGTADFIGRRKAGGMRAVRDMKTGYLDVTSAADNAQLLFFASALYLLEGAAEIEGSIAKVKPDGQVFYGRQGTAVYTPLELDRFLDRLEETVRRVGDARARVLRRRLPTVTLGPHCRYCEAAHACPAKTRLAREMVPTLDAMAGVVELMTREERGRCWELANEQAKPLLESVLEALKERIVTDGEVPLSGGRVAKAFVYPQERVIARQALELARELGATEDQLRACHSQVTVTTVRSVKAPGARKGRAA